MSRFWSTLYIHSATRERQHTHSDLFSFARISDRSRSIYGSTIYTHGDRKFSGSGSRSLRTAYVMWQSRYQPLSGTGWDSGEGKWTGPRTPDYTHPGEQFVDEDGNWKRATRARQSAVRLAPLHLSLITLFRARQIQPNLPRCSIDKLPTILSAMLATRRHIPSPRHTEIGTVSLPARSRCASPSSNLALIITFQNFSNSSTVRIVTISWTKIHPKLLPVLGTI